MKQFILAIAVLSLFSGKAQSLIKGTVKDAHGAPISYADVGIVGTTRGITTDAQGAFSLNVADYKPTDSLFVSHLSYERKAFTIASLRGQQPLTVILEERTIEVPEVTVNIKKGKEKTLMGKGVRVVAGSVCIIPDEFETSGSEELGDFMHLKKDHIATQFELRLLKNTAQTLLRLEFYSVNGDKSNFTPLIHEPIYIELPQTKKAMILKKSLRVLLPKGEVWIGFRVVSSIGKKGDETCFAASFSGCWVRNGNDLEKIPLGLGMQFAVKGYSVE